MGLIKRTKEEYDKGGITNVVKEKIRKHYRKLSIRHRSKILVFILMSLLKIVKTYNILRGKSSNEHSTPSN